MSAGHKYLSHHLLPSGCALARSWNQTQSKDSNLALCNTERSVFIVQEILAILFFVKMYLITKHCQHLQLHITHLPSQNHCF